ncbi:MAG TPA: nuclear transport factor 2 family protein [Bryobacteraceae bacterium]|nr:nuclear transport factor 2 family protein [Bryobacteraceae bacterium]
MKRHLMLLLAASCLALAATPEEEIRAAEKKWADAVVARDYAALDKIYTPALIYAHSTGAIENRQKYMDRLKSGAQKYDGITQESIQIVPYGDSVVSHTILRMTGSNASGPFNNRVMAMHLWVKQNGAWRLAAHQTTLLP